MSLLALQRDFRSWLTDESDGAARRLSGTSAPGLAVYLNNYRGQLMACLAASHPVLHAWLGRETFDQASASHIDRLPPSAWTLDSYGLEFPETLAALFPDDPEVAELAALERELDLAFVGPDSQPIDLDGLGEPDWDRVVFSLAPTFRIRTFSTNACAIWSAIESGAEPPTASLLDEPVDVAIWRSQFTPIFRSLTHLESTALRMARDGREFGAICSGIADIAGPAEGLRAAGEFLAEWLRVGIISSIRS
jgi:hypothetical protein